MSRIFSENFNEAEDEMDLALRSLRKNARLETLLARFGNNELIHLLRFMETTGRNTPSNEILGILKNALKNAAFDAENAVTSTVGYADPESTIPLQNQPSEPEFGGMSKFKQSVGATAIPNNLDYEVETNLEIPIMGMTTDLDRNSPEPDERFDASPESLNVNILDYRTPEQSSLRLIPINYGNLTTTTPMIHPGNHSIGDNTTSLLPMDNTTAIASVFGILGLGALCYVIRKWTPAGRIAAAKVEAKLNKQIGHARSKRQNRENKSYVLSQMTDSTIIVIDQPQDLQKPFKGLFIRKY